jgi:hypothetical protein
MQPFCWLSSVSVTWGAWGRTEDDDRNGDEPQYGEPLTVFAMETYIARTNGPGLTLWEEVIWGDVLVRGILGPGPEGCRQLAISTTPLAVLAHDAALAGPRTLVVWHRWGRV